MAGHANHEAKLQGMNETVKKGKCPTKKEMNTLSPHISRFYILFDNTLHSTPDSTSRPEQTIRQGMFLKFKFKPTKINKQAGKNFEQAG